MSLTFYYAPHSTASMVHWTMEELGIDYEAVQVDIRSDEDKKSKLGPINPNLKVPVLVHDGVAIYESVAIQIYLGETFGVERGLYPQAGLQRAEAVKWLVWANVTLGAAVKTWQVNISEEVPEKLRNAEVAEQARLEAVGLLGQVDAALKGKEFMLGDSISIVDFHFASFLEWLGYCGVDLAQFKNIPAWLGRCQAREAPKKLNAA